MHALVTGDMDWQEYEAGRGIEQDETEILLDNIVLHADALFTVHQVHQISFIFGNKRCCEQVPSAINVGPFMQYNKKIAKGIAIDEAGAIDRSYAYCV